MHLLRIAAVAAAWFLPVAVVAWLVAVSAAGSETVVAKRIDGQGATEDGPRASSGSRSGADPSPELMRALMAWAAPRLDLTVPAVVPVIVRKSHCDLQAIAYQSNDCPELGSGVLALYDANVLWLRDDWRGDSLKDVSILLHELVHHIQHHGGVEPVPCQGEALERPAYEAQFAFLEAAGVNPFETVGINDLMLIMVTNCLGRH